MKQNVEPVIAAEYLLVWWKCCFCKHFKVLLQQTKSNYWCAWLCVWAKDDIKEILHRTWTSGFPYCLYSPLQFRVLDQTFLGSKIKQFCMNYRVSFSPSSHCWKFPLVCWCEPNQHAGISVVHGFICRSGEKCVCRIKVGLRSWISNSAK